MRHQGRPNPNHGLPSNGSYFKISAGQSRLGVPTEIGGPPFLRVQIFYCLINPSAALINTRQFCMKVQLFYLYSVLEFSISF
jgi:hypothetical protein